MADAHCSERTGPQALVFDVETLATRDGPGLRTVVFLKGCPLRCTWCSNPEGQRPEMDLFWESPRCQGCGECVEVCPWQAVELVEGRPSFDRAICSGCSDMPCIQACPTGALSAKGQTRTADEICDLVTRDLRLYWNSGGGVTFGGGEPLCYPDFVAEVAGHLSRFGVSTAIETCGHWPWERVEHALRLAELVYFDLKTLDRERHERLCGRPNDLILRNLARMAAQMPDKTVVSIPVVPGLNADPESLTRLLDHVSTLGLRRVKFVAYHSFGLGKYEALGRPYPHAEMDEPIQPQLLEWARLAATSMGLEAID